MDYKDQSDEEYLRRRRARIARMKAEKRKRERIRKRIRAALFLGVPVVVLAGLIVMVVSIVKHVKASKTGEKTSDGLVAEESADTGLAAGTFADGDYFVDADGNVVDADGNIIDVSIDSSGRPHPEEAYVKKQANADYPFINRHPVEDGMIQVGEVKFVAGYEAHTTSSTISPPEEISQSTYSVLIDESTGEIVSARNAYDMMYPASMTKVMTLLVAVENIKTLDDVVYASKEAADYSYSQDGSAVNWSVGEKLTVKDLLYGTILSSGADASYDLAVYVAGSEEAFVELMNAKVAELGLSATTHFTNCAGFYNDNHYTTPYDMAMIMKAAMENDLCREVMTAHTYNTPVTEEHPEGILISNWFLRRIEDKDTKGFVVAAKTGFVNQSGNNAVSYMISNGGTPYICVTGHAHSAWRAIYDHVGLYYNYTK